MSIFNSFRQMMQTPSPAGKSAERQVDKKELERHLSTRNWSEAERYFITQLQNSKLGDGIRLEILIALAQAQRELKKLSEAAQSANTALELAKHKREYAGELASMLEIAEIYMAEGKIASALQTRQEIVKQETARSRPDVAIIATQTRKIGSLLSRLGERDDARFAFERALAFSEKIFGLQHAETAACLTDLGAFLREQGEHVEAQKKLRQALEVHHATTGRDSAEVVNDLYHLAASLEESGDLNGAISEYERAILSYERQIGNSPAEFAIAKVRLAALYLQDERSSAARELLLHALRVLEKTGGQHHLFALQALAVAEEQANRPVEAAKVREKAEKLAAKLNPQAASVVHQELEHQEPPAISPVAIPTTAIASTIDSSATIDLATASGLIAASVHTGLSSPEAGVVLPAVVEPAFSAPPASASSQGPFVQRVVTQQPLTVPSNPQPAPVGLPDPPPVTREQDQPAEEKTAPQPPAEDALSPSSEKAKPNAAVIDPRLMDWLDD